MMMILVEWAWKGSLILSAGLAAVLICRRVPARRKVSLLFGAAVAAIVVPLISVGLAWTQPAWALQIPQLAIFSLQSARETPSAPIEESKVDSAGPSERLTETPGMLEAKADQAWPQSWEWLLSGLWVFGFVWLVLRDAITRQRLRRYLETLAISDETAPAGVDFLRVDDQGSMPWVCRIGSLGRCLVLPAAAAGWSQAERGMVLAHELGHLRHNDPGIRRCMLWLTALVWFNPLAWICRAVLHHLQEEACDAAVLKAGYPAVDYATWLLAAARSGNPALPAASLAMVRYSGIGKRIRRVLSGTRLSRPARLAGPLLLLGALVLGLGLVSPLLADNGSSGQAFVPDSIFTKTFERWDIIIRTVSLPLTPGREQEAVELRNLDSLGSIGPVLGGDQFRGDEPAQGLPGGNTGLLKPPLPAILPFATGSRNLSVSMGFGPNIHPIRQEWYVHQGIDIAGPVGTKVIAPNNGTVQEVGSRPEGEGNYLILEVEGSAVAISGYRTCLKFAHLQSLPAFRAGDKIMAGQLIGLLGNSGVSTGAHLHYELLLYQGDMPVMALDPMGLAAIVGSRPRQKYYRVGTVS